MRWWCDRAVLRLERQEDDERNNNKIDCWASGGFSFDVPCTAYKGKANQIPKSCGKVDHAVYNRVRSITMWQRTWS